MLRWDFGHPAKGGVCPGPIRSRHPSCRLCPHLAYPALCMITILKTSTIPLHQPKNTLNENENPVSFHPILPQRDDPKRGERMNSQFLKWCGPLALLPMVLTFNSRI